MVFGQILKLFGSQQHTIHKVIILKDSDVVILGSHNKLIPAVRVVVTERHATDVVPGNGPVLVLPSVIKALDAAVASDEEEGV